MAYHITGNIVGYQDVSEVSTTRRHPLGTEVDISDGDNSFRGRAIYVSFPTSTAYSTGTVLVADTATGTATDLRMKIAPTAGSSGDMVFVTLSPVSSNAAVQYGWVLTEGIAPTLKTAVKPINSSTVNISGTAGRVYITASATKRIIGARFAQSSVTTTTSLVNIYYNRAFFPGV
jgi:hypothetical protein